MVSVELSNQIHIILLKDFEFKNNHHQNFSKCRKSFWWRNCRKKVPTIQIAGSILWKFIKDCQNGGFQFPKKNVMIAGAASGLAAAFNTPLGVELFCD